MMRSPLNRFPLVLLLVLLTPMAARSQEKSESEFDDVLLAFERTISLLSNEAVQKELKASEDQAEKMNQLAEEQAQKRQAVLATLPGRPPEERNSIVREHWGKTDTEVQKRLNAILDPAQLKRFNQIFVQFLWLSAFSTPGVKDALKLSEEQAAKIYQIKLDLEKALHEKRSRVKNNDPDATQTVLNEMIKIGKSEEAKVLALLTDKQRTTWKELTGKPFLLKPDL